MGPKQLVIVSLLAFFYGQPKMVIVSLVVRGVGGPRANEGPAGWEVSGVRGGLGGMWTVIHLMWSN